LAPIITPQDIEWLKIQYPNLRINLVNNIIEGKLEFKIDYKGYKIADYYNIRIDLNKLDTLKLPKVYETSNKIESIAEKHNVSIDNLHINPDKSFCMVIEGKEKDIFKNEFTWEEFFRNGIEKFLFQMSYYENEGKLPWGEYAHGKLGYIELYAEGGIILNKLLSFFDKKEIISLVLTNRQSNCLCGSGGKMRKCHPLIFKGIKKMKGYISDSFHPKKGQKKINTYIASIIPLSVALGLIALEANSSFGW